MAGSIPSHRLCVAGVLIDGYGSSLLNGVNRCPGGFWLGEWLRSFIRQDLFRKIVLWVFLMMGGRLIVVGLF